MQLQRFLLIAAILLLAILRSASALEPPAGTFVARRKRDKPRPPSVGPDLRLRLDHRLKQQAELKVVRVEHQRQLAKQERAAAKRIDDGLQRIQASTKASSVSSGARKLDLLLRRAAAQAAAGKTGPTLDPHQLRLSDAEFRKLVLESPRPYWLLVSLTTLESPAAPGRKGQRLAGQQPPCMLCSMAHNATSEFSPGLHRLNQELFTGFSGEVDGTETFVRSALASGNKTALPVWPVQMTLQEHRSLMIELQLRSLPQVFLLPPKFSPSSSHPSTFFQKLPTKYLMPVSAAANGRDAMLEWVAKVIGRPDLPGQVTQALGPDAPGANVLQTMARDLQRRPGHEQAAIAGLLVLGLGLALPLGTPLFWRVRTYRRLFLAAGWAIYMWGISGAMFNILKETEFWVDGRSAPQLEGLGLVQQLAALFRLAAQFCVNPYKGGLAPVVVPSDLRMQTRSESVVFGVLLTATAASLVALAGLARKRAPPGVFGLRPVAVHASPLASAQRLVRIWAGLLGLMLFAVAAFGWYQVLLVFSHKQQRYDMGWVPGAGPLLDTFWGPVAALWHHHGLGEVVRRVWEPVATTLPGGAVQVVAVGFGLILLTFF